MAAVESMGMLIEQVCGRQVDRAAALTVLLSEKHIDSSGASRFVTDAQCQHSYGDEAVRGGVLPRHGR
jgi:hypothetical protein